MAMLRKVKVRKDKPLRFLNQEILLSSHPVGALPQEVKEEQSVIEPASIESNFRDLFTIYKDRGQLDSSPESKSERVSSPESEKNPSGKGDTVLVTSEAYEIHNVEELPLEKVEGIDDDSAWVKIDERDVL